MLKLVEVATRLNVVVVGPKKLSLGVKARTLAVMNQKRSVVGEGLKDHQKKPVKPLQVPVLQESEVVEDQEKVNLKNQRAPQIKEVLVVVMTKVNENLQPKENGVSEAICQPVACLVYYRKE